MSFISWPPTPSQLLSSLFVFLTLPGIFLASIQPQNVISYSSSRTLGMDFQAKTLSLIDL
jgi:hypothetical protein